MRTLFAIAATAVLSAHSSSQSKYPVRPVPLPDAEEIALATTAAPAEISERADVFTIKDGKPVRIRQGTNGAACMVARDSHEGSSYPICYDAEGVRTRMQRELTEVSLRMNGIDEAEIGRRIARAYETGTLKRPEKITVAYMMSPKQVIYSSANADGRRVGAWWPHLMISAPGLSASELGLPSKSAIAAFSVDAIDGHHNELVVQLHSWSDGSAARK